MKAETVGIIPVTLKRWVEVEDGEEDEHAERAMPIAAIIGAGFHSEDGEPSAEEAQEIVGGKVEPAATVKLLSSGVLFVIEVVGGDTYFVETGELVTQLGYAALEAHREGAAVEQAAKEAVDEIGDADGDGGGKIKLV